MISYNLDSIKAAEKLYCKCQKYYGKMDIDIVHGRQTVDAFSILGICALIGNIVTLEPISDNRELIKQLEKDFEED